MLREEELIRIARMRRVKPWQEERRYIQALILYAVADWPLVLRARTHIPPFILVSERPVWGCSWARRLAALHSLFSPARRCPQGGFPRGGASPGNGSLQVSCPSLLY